MGYYTGEVFEVRWGDVGYSIAGGGRYDNMIGKYMKQSVPAVGFSIGFERIVGLLMERGIHKQGGAKRVALFHQKNADMVDVIAKADSLRDAGYDVNLIVEKKKVGKQINHCEEQGYAGFMVYGRDTDVRFFEDK